MPLLTRLANFSISLFNVSLSYLAFLYPAWRTYKVLEGRNRKDAEAMLIYWVVHAWLACFRVFLDEFFVNLVPHFDFYKSILMLILISPWVGVERIYIVAIRPFFQAHEEELDAVIEKSKKQIEAVEDAAAVVETVAKGAIDVVGQEAARIGIKTKLKVRELSDAIKEGGQDIGSTGLEVYRVIRRRVKKTAVRLGLRQPSIAPTGGLGVLPTQAEVEKERAEAEQSNDDIIPDNEEDSDSEYEIERMPVTPHTKLLFDKREQMEHKPIPSAASASAPSLSSVAEHETPSSPTTQQTGEVPVHISALHAEPDDFEMVPAAAQLSPSSAAHPQT